MSLQKQLVHLNLTGGAQTKDDPFLVIPSKLAVADDVEFDDLSTVKPRDGQALVSPTALDGTTLANAWRLATHAGRAIVECEDSNFVVNSDKSLRAARGGRPDDYTVNAPYNAPRASAAVRSAGVAHRRTSATVQCQAVHDSAISGAYQLTAWAQQGAAGEQSIEFRIDDASVEAPVADARARGVIPGADPTLLAAHLSPRVLPSATGFWVCYAAYNALAGPPSAFTILARPVTFAGAIGAAVTIYTSAATGALEASAATAVMFDASATNATGVYQYGFVVRDTNAAGTLSFLLRDAAMAATFTRTIVPSALPVSLTAYTSYIGGTTRVHGFFGVGTNSLRSAYATAAAISAEIAVGTAAAGLVVGRIAVGSGSQFGSDILVAYDAATALSISDVYFSKFSSTHGALSEAGAEMRGWSIAGHIHADSGKSMMPFSAFTPQGASTWYLADLSFLSTAWGTSATAPNIVARLAVGEAFFTENPYTYSSRRVPAGGFYAVTGFRYSFVKLGRNYVAAGSTNATQIQVAVASVSARYLGQLGFAEANRVTFLAGACPYIFDGAQFVEEGFHHAPILINTGSAVVGPTAYGPFAAGACTFVFTETWTDAQGNFHESAPSVELSVTFTGPLPYLSVDPIRPPTQKAGSSLRVYRTKIASTDTSLYLTVTPDGTCITSDTTLANSEQIYTSGNVLPNTPAPACRHVAVFQDRLVLSGCEDGSRIHWSKQYEEGYGVEFASDDPLHQTTAPEGVGRVVGTQELDGRLVVLCERAAGTISGTGPSPTGLQGQYSDFSTQITELGADWASPNSIVRGPEGVWFRSPRGIRLFSRGGALARGQDGKQVGAEMDALVSGTAFAAIGDTKQQIRFYQSSGTVLVWDYQWQQWTRFTGFGVVNGAVYAGGAFFHSNADLVRYTPSVDNTDVDSAGDPNAQIEATVETPWLSFAGIQGFQRIYRLMVLGREDVTSGEDTTLTLSAYTDFQNVGPETATYTNAQSAGLWQAQHHFAKQKCESMKLRIAWYGAPGTAARLRLTDLTLQVGVKSGYNKLPSSQRF